MGARLSTLNWREPRGDRQITWTSARVEAGLCPAEQRTVPSWFGGPKTDEDWSLICNFDPAPSKQGNPTTARVSFLVDGAPHDRLAPGATHWLFEELGESYARVELLD